MPGYTDAWLKHTQLPFDCLRIAGVRKQVMLYPISSCMDMKQDTKMQSEDQMKSDLAQYRSRKLQILLTNDGVDQQQLFH